MTSILYNILRNDLGNNYIEEKIMNGPLAQIVSITAHANAEIESTSSTTYSLNNSTAQFCRKIKYIDWVKKQGLLSLFKVQKKHVEKPLANDFLSWINFLKIENVKQLFHHYIPSENPQISDRMTAGFVGGGGRWLIEAWKGNSSDYWEAKWEVTDHDAEDRRIWTVTYARISRNDIVRKNMHSGLSGITDKLKNAILACKTFSESHQLEGWKEYFVNALDCLECGNTNLKTIYHKDIIPLSKYSDEAKRILFSVQSAWVFGGMGSWNDMMFENNDQNLYEMISDQLFKALCEAIPHATNEYELGN